VKGRPYAVGAPGHADGDVATAERIGTWHAAKLATERWYLLYTPLWTGLVAVVLSAGAFARWHDREYMLFGVALCAPICLLPLFKERHLPLFARHSFKTALFITLLSFLQNYFGTPFFARCFGLEYHFPTRLNLNGYPVFLSLLTIAYFATYFAVMQGGLRIVEKLGRRVGAGSLSPRLFLLRRVVVTFLLAYCMAFAETLTMATDLLHGYFAYADKSRMLSIGSLCYGTLLFLAQRSFLRIDPEPARPTPLSTVVGRALGVSMLVLCLYELFAYLIGRGIL
jgi:hypothetical protein